MLKNKFSTKSQGASFYKPPGSEITHNQNSQPQMITFYDYYIQKDKPNYVIQFLEKIQKKEHVTSNPKILTKDVIKEVRRPSVRSKTEKSFSIDTLNFLQPTNNQTKQDSESGRITFLKKYPMWSRIFSPSKLKFNSPQSSQMQRTIQLYSSTLGRNKINKKNLLKSRDEKYKSSLQETHLKYQIQSRQTLHDDLNEKKQISQQESELKKITTRVKQMIDQWNYKELNYQRREIQMQRQINRLIQKLESCQMELNSLKRN